MTREELTWEDIREINKILFDLYFENWHTDSPEQEEARDREALRRFNKMHEDLERLKHAQDPDVWPDVQGCDHNCCACMAKCMYRKAEYKEKTE